MVRIFTSSRRDQVFIPQLSHTKDSGMVLDASLLNTQHYNVKIKDNWSNPEKGVVSFPTYRCSSYQKGSLQVTHDYSRPTTYVFIYTSTENFTCMTKYLLPMSW